MITPFIHDDFLRQSEPARRLYHEYAAGLGIVDYHSHLPPRDVATLHARVLDRLGPSPVAEDQLIRDLGGDARAVSPVLIDLELEGRISRQPGGLIARLD